MCIRDSINAEYGEQWSCGWPAEHLRAQSRTMDPSNGARGRGRGPPAAPGRGSPNEFGGAAVGGGETLLTKRKLESLTGSIQQQQAGRGNGNVDHVTLSPEVAEVLCELATDFVENAAAFGCRLAKHRKSKVLEVRDLQAYLERNWDISVPGFGTTEERVYRNKPTEAYRQKVVTVQKAAAQQAAAQLKAAAAAEKRQQP
eukprot:TRINITY_DN20965_c0_g1_i2.p1 TRINITY_DN20965_c0_g1~~TRINITY_DN20965_c0_g1_i2.p1  ORF type:complete len:214 (+),score=35.77 TRINITY_DN20965_c0_g1_i2:44-643(+)